MTNLIENLRIVRISKNKQFMCSYIRFDKNGVQKILSSKLFAEENENEALLKLLDKFSKHVKSASLRNLILEKFQQLNCRKDDTFGCMLIPLPRHLSCRLNENYTISGENLLSQSDIKEKLETLDKNSKIVK